MTATDHRTDALLLALEQTRQHLVDAEDRGDQLAAARHRAESVALGACLAHRCDHQPHRPDPKSAA